MQTLELKIPPIVLVFFTGALMWIVKQAPWSANSAFPDAKIAVVILIAGGATIAILGVLEFRSAGTTVDPRAPGQSVSLVVQGVYRLSRNPMYLGFLLMLCGWAIFLRSVHALILLPIFILYMNRFQIKPEERHMNDKFGEAFRQYSREVRRWV